MSKILRQKIFRPEGESNPNPRMLDQDLLNIFFIKCIHIVGVSSLVTGSLGKSTQYLSISVIDILLPQRAGSNPMIKYHK